MQSLSQDIRYAFRTLVKSSGFALTATLTLSLGIGANTAIFSIVNAVLLRSMPFYRSDRIVLLWGDDRDAGDARSQVSFTDIADFRAAQSTCEEVATLSSWNPLLSGTGEAARVNGALVGDGFFKVMGSQPLLGRVFSAEEQLDGKDSVVILSHELWQMQFGGDPNVIGKTLLLNLRPHNIVGVMPADFHSLPATLIGKPAVRYRPVAESVDEKMRSARHLRAIARLKDGVTLDQAQTDMNLIARRLEQQHPESNTNWGIHLVSLQEDTVRDLRHMLWLLFGAVGFVLLIACANVANLMLSRATMRAGEMSIRAALGASRWRLLQQTLTESALLSLLGGAAGWLLALWCVGFLKELAGRMLPQLADVRLNISTLCFTLIISLLTAIIFGLAPGFYASRVDLNGALKDTGRGKNSGSRPGFRNALVVTEIAVALVLLICAGLMIRSVSGLQKVNPGFDSTQVLKMDLGLPSLKYPTDEKRIAFYRKLTAQVQTLPGVIDAGVVTPLPVSSGFDLTGFEVEGQPAPVGQGPQADRYIMTPGYLHALGIPLRHGRELTQADQETSQPVLLVSEKLADRFWPNGDAIGRRIKLPWNPGREDSPWRAIVGIVADVKQYGPDKPGTMALYLPHAQYPVSFMTLVVRTSGDPAAMIGPVRNAVRAIDSDQVPTEMATMQDVMKESIELRRFATQLLAAFAILALTLAMIGIYGVISYGVAQRTREIGVRVALGAGRRDVLKLILRTGISLTLLGLALGISGALALTRLLSSLLFGVTPTDSWTFVIVCFSLFVTAVLACYLPARRATKVDPLEALRYE